MNTNTLMQTKKENRQPPGIMSRDPENPHAEPGGATKLDDCCCTIF